MDTSTNTPTPQNEAQEKGFWFDKEISSLRTEIGPVVFTILVVVLAFFYVMAFSSDRFFDGICKRHQNPFSQFTANCIALTYFSLAFLGKLTQRIIRKLEKTTTMNPREKR